MTAGARVRRDRYRFGIGEWYGELLQGLTPEKRRYYASIQRLKRAEQPPQICRFQSKPGVPVTCTKQGGVCSLRRYVENAETGRVMPAADATGRLRTVCPFRFREDGMVYSWVGDVLIDSKSPIVLGEIGFLSGVSSADASTSDEGGADVGRIDQVLVVPDSDPLVWCALEVQAVYFQGASMSSDFRAIESCSDDSIPFPTGVRRPDYRSSAPKRLMPQLQIKVPSMRRWGKKMAVVVDRDFFEQLAPMSRVRDVSNCDIAWFILGYEEAVKKQNSFVERYT
ncbi:MAG: hypothetical protein M1370_12495 [Bacteroidetes bacterium]|nr:hypothetical protein [Bacteroidota bacterium]